MIPANLPQTGRWVSRIATSIMIASGFCPMSFPAEGDLQQARPRDGRPAVAKSSKTLDVASADKIVFYGVSSTASAYALRGKSWVSKLAQELDYICINQGRSSQTYDEYAFNIRDGNLVGCAPGVVLRDLRPTYIFLVSSVGNPGIGGWGGLPETWDSTLLMHSIRNAVKAARSVGARPVIGTDQMICGSAMIDSLLYDFARQNRIPYAPIGTIGEQINFTRYQPYWPGNHPATRSNSLNTGEWLAFFSQFPSPVRSLKIFRKRSALPLNGDVNRLNYDSVEERQKRFQEIDMGDSCLLPEAEKYYDRLDEYFKTGYRSRNEYTTLIAGNEGVPFEPDAQGDAVALLDFTVDAVMPDRGAIYIKSSAGALEFYLKNNLARPGELKYIKGVVFEVEPSVYDALDDTYNGAKYTSDQVGTTGEGGILIYEGKYHDYNVGYLVCLNASTTVGRRNWRVKKPGVLKSADGGRDIPHTGFVHLRKDYQFFHSLRDGFGEFQEISAEKTEQGYWSIRPDPKLWRACVDYDNVKLLVKCRTGFAVEDVFLEHSGGTPKRRAEAAVTTPKRQYTEKFPVNTFSADLADSGWTVAEDTGKVAVESVPKCFRDYPVPRRCAGYGNAEYHCNLGVDDKGRPSAITRRVVLNQEAVGYRRLVFRAIARVFPKNYITRDAWDPGKSYVYTDVVYHDGHYYRNAKGKPFTYRGGGEPNLNHEPRPDSAHWTRLDGVYITDTPVITPDSYDLGTLCIALNHSNRITRKVIKRKVRIGWSEIYVETWLPPFVKSFDLSLFKDPYDFVDANYHNHTFPLQLFYTSLQIEGD